VLYSHHHGIITALSRHYYYNCSVKTVFCRFIIMDDNNNNSTAAKAPAAAGDNDDDDSTTTDEDRSGTIGSTAAAAVTNSNSSQRSPAAASATTSTTPTSAGAATAKRKSSPGTTTARHKKKTKASTKIKIGCRVYSTRKSLYHIVKEEQRKSMKDFADNYKVFGTVRSGNTNKGYLVEFDMFPAAQKTVQLTRKRLTTLSKDEEEVNNTTTNSNDFLTIDNDEDDDDDVEVEDAVATGTTTTTTTTATTKKKKVDPLKESIKKFSKLDKATLQSTTVFEMQYGEEVEEKIIWEILEDNKHIETEDDPLHYPDQLHFKKELDFDSSEYDSIFFNDFFPSITGHGVLLDEFHSDTRSPYHRTITRSGYKFNDSDADDPDWIVKQCYLLLIASVTEADVGVENLWKKGVSGGRHEFANFGQYIPMNMFKAFQSGAALMFCDKKWWFEDVRDRDWDIAMPCIASYNEKRKQLFHTILLMLDESMSGWRPKTSKLGGLPNITFEPRKPVPLGTQFKNGIECLAGTMAFQDIVQAPEIQKRKEFYSVLDADEVTNIIQTTSLPGNPPIQAHTAEVLRQVSGAGVMPGGWTGGDAWFGSVMTCVELMKQLEVHSTFIVKNNVLFYPMVALHSVLKARHGERPAGHWVVMRATIADVKLTAIAYAWSQKGVSYFISTCGSTEPSPIKYESKFEDEWGNTNFRELDRPQIVHFLYEYLPLIDEHNKQRQSILALEKRWLTKDPWFRLLCTVVGMSVVDMHRCFRYNSIKVQGKEQDDIDLVRVQKFTDLICGNLKKWKYKQHHCTVADSEPCLERIRDSLSGQINRSPTRDQVKKGRNIGNPAVLTCFICRRYLDEQNTPIRRTTSYWCKTCQMPLCKQSRIDCDGGRTLACLEEHQQSDDATFSCSGNHNRGTCVPEGKHIQLHTRARRSQRLQR
jgi:hypothetical protein